jgi:uncharacterized protein YcfJ
MRPMNMRMGLACGALLALAGCATTPMAPTIRVMPAPNQPFQAFQADDAACRQYAAGAVKGMADASNNKAVGGAVVGSLVGAVVGAALGGPGPHHDNGLVAAGAVAGGAIGASNGSNAAGTSQYGIQQAYDSAYAQCMYARGNQVPGTPAR